VCVCVCVCVSDTVGGVIQTLPVGNPVLGVTSLDNRLYMLRHYVNWTHIEVYDVDSFLLLRYLTVSSLGAAGDIVACAHNACAYVSDWSNNSVGRVTLSDATVAYWPVGDKPTCLSLTATHGVLVTCWEVSKVKEFSTDGQLLRELTLPQEIVLPLHAVQLSSGGFAVCHGLNADHLHGVCLIGSDGGIVKMYGGPAGSDTRDMNVPAHMAVDENGFLFVVDHNNRRVLLLSPMLNYVRDVVPRQEFGWVPVRVHVDSARRRLYVALNDTSHTAGGVAVFSV